MILEQREPFTTTRRLMKANVLHRSRTIQQRRSRSPFADGAQRVEDRIGFAFAFAQQAALIQHLHELAHFELAGTAGNDQLGHRHVAMRQVAEHATVDRSVVGGWEFRPGREFEFLHIPRVGPLRLGPISG